MNVLPLPFFVSRAMSPIVAMETSSSEPASRLGHEFLDMNDHFRLPVAARDYHKQFASLYTRRLETTTRLLETRAAEKWGKDVPIKKLYQIQDAGRCILVRCGGNSIIRYF